MSLAFATSILSNEFLMLRQEHEALVAFAVATMNGQQAEPPYKPSGQPYCVVGTGERMSDRAAFDKAPKGAIAVIPVKGTLMLEDQTSWSGIVYPGTKTMARWAMQADMDDAIDGVVFHVTFPGGMAMGSEHLHTTLASLKKPTVAVYDELACSAAIFGTCGVGTVLATTKSSRIGSIGTMTSFMDFSGLFEKFGIKMHEVYATKSTDKNKEFRDAMKGDYTSLIENGLDPLNEVFHAAVKSGRGDKLKLDKENVLTGKVYMGEQAKKYGLIDGFGNIQDAVRSIRKTQTSNSSIKSSNNMAFEKVLVASKATEFAVVEGGFMLSEDNLNNVESVLATAETNAGLVATLNTTVNSLNGKITEMTAAANTAATTISANATRIQELEGQVAALGKGASGKGTVLKTAEDVNNGEQKSEHKFAGDELFDAQQNKKPKTDYSKLIQE